MSKNGGGGGEGVGMALRVVESSEDKLDSVTHRDKFIFTFHTSV